jgi:hypothetical protein
VRICLHARAISSACGTLHPARHPQRRRRRREANAHSSFSVQHCTHLDDLNSRWEALLVLVLCPQEVFLALHPPLLLLKQRQICHALRAVSRSETKKLSNVTFRSLSEHSLSDLRGDAGAHPVRVLLRVAGRHTRAHPSESGRVSHHSYIFSILLANTTMLALEVSNQKPARPWSSLFPWPSVSSMRLPQSRCPLSPSLPPVNWPARSKSRLRGFLIAAGCLSVSSWMMPTSTRTSQHSRPTCSSLYV